MRRSRSLCSARSTAGTAAASSISPNAHALRSRTSACSSVSRSDERGNHLRAVKVRLGFAQTVQPRTCDVRQSGCFNAVNRPGTAASPMSAKRLGGFLGRRGSRPVPGVGADAAVARAARRSCDTRVPPRTTSSREHRQQDCGSRGSRVAADRRRSSQAASARCPGICRVQPIHVASDVCGEQRGRGPGPRGLRLPPARQHRVRTAIHLFWRPPSCAPRDPSDRMRPLKGWAV